MIEKTQRFFNRLRIAPEARLIIGLFCVSRVLLTIIGIISRTILDASHGNGRAEVTKNVWLDIWGVWDTGWYLNIAKNWYTTTLSDHGGANYGFFPLYPLLMRIVGVVTRHNYIAGIIVSNIALLATAYVLYKLVKYESNEKTARQSVKFLFLFPTAFIFSAVFSESLFLMCMCAAFYAARREKWFWVGGFGGLTALTRSVGVFIGVPLFWEYLRSKDFRIQNVRPDILWLGFIPLGLSLFGLQCYQLTGDFLAFSHIQQTGWGHEWSNPLGVIWGGLTDKNPLHFVNALTTVVMIAILSVGAKQIGSTFFMAGMMLILFPPLAGKVCMNSMLRYSLVVFPVYIVLAKLPEESPANQLITVGLAMLQGFMMVFWTNGFHLII